MWGLCLFNSFAIDKFEQCAKIGTLIVWHCMVVIRGQISGTERAKNLVERVQLGSSV